MTELEDPVILPWEVRLAPATRYTYFRDSRWFLMFAGYADPKKIRHRPGPSLAYEATRAEIEKGMRSMLLDLRRDEDKARRLALAFIRKQNERIRAGEVGTEELRAILKPIRLAFEMNEILVPWKKYSRLIERGRVTAKDRPYTMEEVRLVLAKASLHMQVPVLFMVSGGLRVGAFDYLDVGDVRPVYSLDGRTVVAQHDCLCLPSEGLPPGAKLLCGAVRVYSDEFEDEYDALVSKEACVKWRAYLETRVQAGEEVLASSPAIVVRGGARRLKAESIGNTMNDLLWAAGVRKGQRGKVRRHEVQMDHGFRKVFDNVMNDHADKVYVELLIGHGSRVVDERGSVDLGVSKHYDRGLPLKAVEQYLLAMPYLSVEEAYRDELLAGRRAAEAVKAKDEDLRELRLQVQELRGENRDFREAVRELRPYMDELRRRRGAPERDA